MNTDAPLAPAPLPENLVAPAGAGRTLVMGVVNVTPDSFSDGGRWATTELAVAHGRQLIAQGADLLDVGGESTRPGARRVDPAEEQERVQILPKIIKVAVPCPQHSPILGQLPEVQIVLSWYLSTKLRNSVYFFPVGSFTLSHWGLAVFSTGAVVVVSIFLIFSCKGEW